MTSIIYFIMIYFYLISLFYCVSNTEWLAAILMHVLLPPVGLVHGVFLTFGNSWF